MKNLADLTMPHEMGRANDTSIAGLQMIEPVQVKPVLVKKVARPSYRLPSKDEQIKAWEKLMFEINMHRSITMNSAAVEACLKRIDAFVDAHSRAEQLFSIEEIRGNVVQAFWEQVAQAPAVGLQAQPSAVIQSSPTPEKKPRKAPTKRAKRKVPVKRTSRAKSTPQA